MKPCTSEFTQGNVSGCHHGLRRVRYTRKPQPGSSNAFIHDAVCGEVSVLAMGYDQQPKTFGVLKGTTHQLGIHDRIAVIRERYNAGSLHLTILGEAFAAESLAYGAHRIDAHRCRHSCLLEYIFCY